MDLCRIIFLFSDLITKEALILLHNDDRKLFEMEAAPNNRNALASLTEDVVLEIFAAFPPAPCCATNVSVTPETASSPTTVRCFPCGRLLLRR
jgi:hypothetical protein